LASLYAREVICRAHGDIGHSPSGLARHQSDRNVCVLLVVRHGEERADAAAAGPPAAALHGDIERSPVVPDYITIVLVDLSAGASEDQWIDGGMVNVDLAVPTAGIFIGCAMVSGGGANRDPERHGR